MSETTWRIHATGHARFPYRISLVQSGRETLVLRAQSRWPGPGQQVFCLRQHNSRGRTNLFGEREIGIVIDSSERYPWKFANAEVRRSSLPAGDYALIHEERPAAVVERKSFDNLLADGSVAELAAGYVPGVNGSGSRGTDAAVVHDRCQAG